MATKPDTPAVAGSLRTYKASEVQPRSTFKIIGAHDALQTSSKFTANQIGRMVINRALGDTSKLSSLPQIQEDKWPGNACSGRATSRAFYGQNIEPKSLKAWAALRGVLGPND